MTLLFLTSTLSRESILRVLEGAREGDHRAAEEGAEEAEAAIEAGFEGGLDEAAMHALPSDVVIGPHTKVRLSSKGRELNFVAEVLERWLARCPEGPLRLGELRAGMAMGALAYGWSGTVVHAVAGDPRSLSELCQLADLPSPEIVEEHVGAMEEVGLLECEDDPVLGERYAATRWLRQGIAPITAAARLERRDGMDDTAPLDALDVGAGLMLALPLIEAPDDVGGPCRLEVELDDGSLAGAVAHVLPGEPMWGDLGIDFEAVETKATASLGDWLDTVIEPGVKRVRTRGDRKLASVLAKTGLQRALFGPDPD